MGRLLKQQFDRIQQEIQAGYIRVAKHPKLDLWIYNYTEKCDFEEHWTAETRMCRGLVLDEYGQIIIPCIPKFFNRGTKFAPVIDFDTAKITEKNDGYMIQIKRDEYIDDQELLVTSRGSFDNKYVDKARELIKGYEREFEPQFTYVCELCADFPGDEGIIVTRHKTQKLVCFAIFDENGVEWNPHPEILPSCLECVRQFRKDEAIKYLQGEVEGVVLIDSNWNRVKVKTDWFLERHRIISNCTKKRVWEVLSTGQLLEDLELPDEFLSQMKIWEEELKTEFELSWQIILVYYNYAQDLSPKEIGLSKLIPQEYKGYIFNLLNDKEQQAMNNLWKKLKPKANEEN